MRVTRRMVSGSLVLLLAAGMSVAEATPPPADGHAGTPPPVAPARPRLSLIEFDFDKCVAASGEDFALARRRFFGNPDAEVTSFFARRKFTGDWKDDATSKILQGWARHWRRYTELLDPSETFITQTGERHYKWSRDIGKLRESDIPLLLELLAKESAGPIAARDAARALVGLNEKGTYLPIDLLLQMLKDPKTPTAQRVSAAYVLGNVTTVAGNAKRFATALAQALGQELARNDRSRDVVLDLLRGLANQSGRMKGADIDALVGEIYANQPLAGLIGRTPLIYSIGNIGGAKAANLLGDYFKSTPDPIERGWVVRALGRGNSVEGTRLLLQYAQDQALGARIQHEAIGALKNAALTPEVITTLGTLGRTGPPAQRRAAVGSLGAILRRPGLKDETVAAIRAHLKEIGDQNPELQPDVNFFLAER